MNRFVQVQLRKYASDERGTIAIMFGLMSFMMFMFVGIAVDMSRIYNSNSRLAAAVDAAALAAGRAMLDGQLSDSEIDAMARDYVKTNYNEAGDNFGTVSIPGLNINIDRSSSTIEIDGLLTVPMAFMGIAGFNQVEIPIETVARFEQQDVELGMALDVTGSMSGQKIADLKTAAKDLVDILLPENKGSNKVRIGLAPYSASINLGKYAKAASDNKSTDGCVVERSGTLANTDAAPGMNAFFNAGKNTLKDIDSTEGISTPAYSCPPAKLEALTDDANLLKSTINSYSVRGWTGGHFGAQWAWNLVSPNWSAFWPAESQPVAYGDGKTIKAVILMTDGVFNTSYYNGKSSDQAKTVCSNMKSEGVVVYAVGFQAPAGALATLQNCASSSDTYFNASNGDELRAAFVAIAQQLNNLRLTQ
jgi:Flp pilus assembly protein TadG